MIFPSFRHIQERHASVFCHYRMNRERYRKKGPAQKTKTTHNIKASPNQACATQTRGSEVPNPVLHFHEQLVFL
jgi:hypothetical protein